MSEFHPVFLPLMAPIVAVGTWALTLVQHKVRGLRESALGHLKVRFHERGWHDPRELARHALEGRIPQDEFRRFSENNPGVARDAVVELAARQAVVGRYRRARWSYSAFVVLPVAAVMSVTVALYAAPYQWVGLAVLAGACIALAIWGRR